MTDVGRSLREIEQREVWSPLEGSFGRQYIIKPSSEKTIQFSYIYTRLQHYRLSFFEDNSETGSFVRPLEKTTSKKSAEATGDLFGIFDNMGLIKQARGFPPEYKKGFDALIRAIEKRDYSFA